MDEMADQHAQAVVDAVIAYFANVEDVEDIQAGDETVTVNFTDGSVMVVTPFLT